MSASASPEPTYEIADNASLKVKIDPDPDLDRSVLSHLEFPNASIHQFLNLPSILMSAIQPVFSESHQSIIKGKKAQDLFEIIRPGGALAAQEMHLLLSGSDGSLQTAQVFRGHVVPRFDHCPGSSGKLAEFILHDVRRRSWLGPQNRMHGSQILGAA